MAEAIQGVIRCRTIELATDPGIEDGQMVEVVVRVIKKSKPWGEGIRRSAGAMADHWTEDDDRILEEIQRDRHRDDRPELTLSQAPVVLTTTGAGQNAGHPAIAAEEA
jgi:hypothetical protein